MIDTAACCSFCMALGAPAGEGASFPDEGRSVVAALRPIWCEVEEACDVEGLAAGD